MTNWHGMKLLVSERNLNPPMDNATIERVLCDFTGSIFQKNSFFMEYLRSYIYKKYIRQKKIQILSYKSTYTHTQKHNFIQIYSHSQIQINTYTHIYIR